MIIAVTGICTNMQNNTSYRQNFAGYQRKFYQPTTKNDLERKIGRDFEKELTTELKKYHIDIIL